MAADKRKIQEINAGSMADIAFLLLIFFLVATTMNVDTGIVRVLPPISEQQQQEDQEVRERNLYFVFVSKSGWIMAGTDKSKRNIDIHQLKNLAKEFIVNRMDDQNMSEKVDKEIMIGSEKWVYPVSEGVVSLQTDRETDYRSYIMAQNELTRAFNEIRDEVAIKKFNKKFSELTEEQSKAIQEAVPLKISEAEPKIVKK